MIDTATTLLILLAYPVGAICLALLGRFVVEYVNFLSAIYSPDRRPVGAGADQPATFDRIASPATVNCADDSRASGERGLWTPRSPQSFDREVS